MLRLYTLWELERELSPEDFQHILTPEAALEKATVSYDLDYRNYTYPPLGEVPRELSIPKDKPYTRADRSVYDPVYDDLEMNLMEGWIIGLDTDEYWDDTLNPFHIDADSQLIFDNADPFCWVMSDFQRAYQIVINNQNGRKPAPTEKYRPSGEPVQHAQVAKTINSKAAGRLLAAGGIYNGNIEGFHQTTQQLGGDAPAGYDQVMDNKGLIIAGTSVAAGLGIGRLGSLSEMEALTKISKGDSGSYLPTGRMGNPMNTIGANPPTIIGDFSYSAHAIDRMQGRGVPPSAIENALSTGDLFSTKAGTTGYYDSINNLRVIVNSKTGNIVTVIPGAPK